MNRKKFVVIVMLISCLQSIAQAIDVDGNTYDTAETEGIVFITQNLNVSKFRNGDEIKQAQSNEEWIQADKNEEPAWCYYNNDEENGKTYGKLYNRYDGSFLSEGKTGSWWSSSAANAYTNSYILLYNSTDKVERSSALYAQGKSVSCIKN
jgi:hypothetical protein